MPVTLESRVRQMQVFNLPHDTYCLDGSCSCSDTTVVVVEENPRTEQFAPRRVGSKTPDSLTLLALERRTGLPDGILEVPEVQAAIARGRVRVIEQTPTPAPSKLAAAPPPPAAAKKEG